MLKIYLQKLWKNLIKNIVLKQVLWKNKILLCKTKIEISTDINKIFHICG